LIFIVRRSKSRLLGEAINPIRRYTNDLRSSTPPVNGLLRFIFEILVESLGIIEIEITSETFNRFRHGLVVGQISLFVFAASPDANNEDVIQCAASAVHADLDLALFENSSKGNACELRTLITVKDLLISSMKCSIERAQAKVYLHHRGDLATEHITRMPINDRDQVNKAGLQTNKCDIHAPYLIHAIDLQPAQQVVMKLMNRSRD